MCSDNSGFNFGLNGLTDYGKRLYTVGQVLREAGWKGEVAGLLDFGAAQKAIELMFATGKGLIVSGGCGVGKTKLCEVIARNIGPVFRINLNVRKELERLTPNWLEYWAIDPMAVSVYLDDLGGEPTLNEYGVKYEAVSDFICEFYMKHTARSRLIISTNLSSSEMNERYGTRIVSRLKELCVPLRLNGGDKRKWSVPK